MNSLSLNIDSSWTLFLDRDGVINRRIVGGYVQHPEEFILLDGVLEALKAFALHFGRIVVVTNQQGIGKGLMTEEQLAQVHELFQAKVLEAGGRIDAIYHCPELASANSLCRKPNTGMGLQAQKEFPEINFSKSVMIGDSESDIEFGLTLGMITAFIASDDEITTKANHQFSGLKEFAQMMGWL